MFTVLHAFTFCFLRKGSQHMIGQITFFFEKLIGQFNSLIYFEPVLLEINACGSRNGN